MNKRYDAVCYSPDKNGKDWSTRIGTAWEGKDGYISAIELTALPIPDKDGRVRIVIFPAKPKDGERSPPNPGGFDESPF